MEIELLEGNAEDDEGTGRVTITEVASEVAEGRALLLVTDALCVVDAAEEITIGSSEIESCASLAVNKNNRTKVVDNVFEDNRMI